MFKSKSRTRMTYFVYFLLWPRPLSNVLPRRSHQPGDAITFELDHDTRNRCGIGQLENHFSLDKVQICFDLFRIVEHERYIHVYQETFRKWRGRG